MAFSISLSGISKKDGSALFVIEPAWWEISKLEKKVKYRWIESNDGSYSDRDADISIDEARILHKQFKSRLVEEITYNTECIESERKQKGTRAFSSARLKDYVKHVWGSHRVLISDRREEHDDVGILTAMGNATLLGPWEISRHGTRLSIRIARSKAERNREISH